MLELVQPSSRVHFEVWAPPATASSCGLLSCLRVSLFSESFFVDGLPMVCCLLRWEDARAAAMPLPLFRLNRLKLLISGFSGLPGNAHNLPELRGLHTSCAQNS